MDLALCSYFISLFIIGCMTVEEEHRPTKAESRRNYRIGRRKAHADENRQWNADHLERRREINRASYHKNREKRLSYCQKYRTTYPIVRKAQWSVHAAVANGLLSRPSQCS